MGLNPVIGSHVLSTYILLNVHEEFKSLNKEKGAGNSLARGMLPNFLDSLNADQCD